MTSTSTPPAAPDRALALREGLMDCYLNAIKNSANYAIELDEQLTADHRRYLRTLVEDIATGDTAVVLESRATLRNLLRDYRDKGSQILAKLRDELTGTARALEEIMLALANADGDHEANLRSTVKRLREIAAAEGKGDVTQVVQQAAESIEETVEQMRKQHQITVSQFQIEIRMLHKRIDSLEASASVDQLTRFYNRGEMVERIKAARAGEYCLLLVTARGLRRAEVQFGQAISDELTGAFAKRLRNRLPPNSVLGRWGTEELVAIVPMKKPDAMSSGKWITEHLSGTYACLQAGKTVRPALQVNVGVLDTGENESPETVLERVGMFLTGA